MQDYEKILIGTWLRQENLNDLKWVRPEDFSEKELIEELKKGKNMLEIGSEMERLPELAELTTFRSDVLYKQAFAQVMSRQIKHDIANMSSLRESVVSFGGSSISSKDSSFGLISCSI